MARSRSVVSSRVVVRERYYWPSAQLNFWTIIILVTGSLLIGVFASFISVQNRMHLGVPWLFPYGITVGCITVTFIILELIMMSQGRLVPGAMMLAAFILLVLFITGLIETSIELFGTGNVSDNCSRYVTNNPVSGVSVSTLAWLEQNSICSSWYAAFSFWIIGTVFMIWMLIMASQVGRGGFEGA